MALEQCSPGSLSMWQTDGDDYLQVEVTGIPLFLLCTKLTKLVDFYNVTGVVLASLLLGWSWQFVIKIYLSTPCIVFTSTDLQPNDLNKLVYFQHEGVYAHRAHIVLQFGCGRPNRGIRAPKYYPKWPSSVFLVYCGQTTVVLPVCCCLWMCSLAVSISFALDELSVS